MKSFKLIPVIVLMLMFQAVDGKAEETLFDHHVDHGGMIAPYFVVGNLGDQTLFMNGYRAQWIINNRFGLGIGKLHSNHKVDAEYNGIDYNLELAQSFLDIEYIINPEDLIHFTVSSAFGHGRLTAWNKATEGKFKDDVYYVHPSANVEINITDWFKVNSGFGWRFSNDAEIENQDFDNLGGWTAQIQLKFGWF